MLMGLKRIRGISKLQNNRYNDDDRSNYAPECA